MANIIPNRSKISSMVRDFTSGDTVTTILTSEANKLWRAKILLDRVTKPGEKDHPVKDIPNTDAAPSLKNGSGKVPARLPLAEVNPLATLYRNLPFLSNSAV